MKLLKLEATENSKKLETMEQDQKKVQADLSWAQSYCSNMDQKIKELEKELAKSRPVQEESTNLKNIKKEITSSIDLIGPYLIAPDAISPITLKIRNDST